MGYLSDMFVDIDASIDAAARRAAQLAEESRKRREEMQAPFSIASIPQAPASPAEDSPPSSQQAQPRPSIVSPLKIRSAILGEREPTDVDDGRPLLLNTLASPRPEPTARHQAAAKSRAVILAEPGVSFRTHDAHDTDPGVGADPNYAEKRPRGLFPADELLKYMFSVSVEQSNVKRAEQERYVYVPTPMLLLE